MTASIYAARRVVFDLWHRLWTWLNLIHCVFRVIKISNTLNHGITHRLDENSSDLLYLEHPWNTRKDKLELNTVTTNAQTRKNGLCNLMKRP